MKSEHVTLHTVTLSDKEKETKKSIKKSKETLRYGLKRFSAHGPHLFSDLVSLSDLLTVRKICNNVNVIPLNLGLDWQNNLNKNMFSR